MTIATKTMIENIKPHLNVGCVYLDNIFRDSMIHVQPSINGLVETLTKLYGSYFLDLNCKDVFIDVILMKPQLLIIIKEY